MKGREILKLLTKFYTMECSNGIERHNPLLSKGTKMNFIYFGKQIFTGTICCISSQTAVRRWPASDLKHTLLLSSSIFYSIEEKVLLCKEKTIKTFIYHISEQTLSKNGQRSKILRNFQQFLFLSLVGFISRTLKSYLVP